MILNYLRTTKKGRAHGMQELIDSILIRLDGTKQKNYLGANSILAVSMAVKKLSAKLKKIPLYKTFLVKNNFQLPYPLMNIINGGAHADNGLRIQEFMIRPDKAKSFSEAMRISFLVVQNLRSLIKLVIPLVRCFCAFLSCLTASANSNNDPPFL